MQSSARIKHTLMFGQFYFSVICALFSIHFAEYIHFVIKTREKNESFYNAQFIVCNNADLYLCYNRLVTVLVVVESLNFRRIPIVLASGPNTFVTVLLASRS